jgi:type II secretory pathway component GspD/PulD (secretin)
METQMRRIGTFSLVVMAAFFVLLVPASGQEQGATQKTGTTEPVLKIIHVKYVDPHEMTIFLSEYGAKMRSNRQTNTISVVGSEAQVEAVEEALKKVDVPPAPA